MMNRRDTRVTAAPSRLAPDERALRDRLAREVDAGNPLAVMPVQQADVGDRVLEATRALLDERGFMVAVIHGGSDNALVAVRSLMATARHEASTGKSVRPGVLVVKDAHLLPPDRLDLLALMGDVAIVAAPVVTQPAPRTRFRWVASILIGVIVVLLVSGAFLLSTARAPVDMAAARGSRATIGPGSAAGTAAAVSATAAAQPAIAIPTETAVRSLPPLPELAARSAPPPDPVGAPGLMIVARDGDTLATLYQRIYRGATPPSFASVAALNPEPVRAGDILTFPAPANGWSMRHDAGAGSDLP